MDSSYYTEQVYGTGFISDASCNLFKIVYIECMGALIRPILLTV
jgi:hypothetical protein